jgi:hypothetical protein
MIYTIYYIHLPLIILPCCQGQSSVQAPLGIGYDQSCKPGHMAYIRADIDLST